MTRDLFLIERVNETSPVMKIGNAVRDIDENKGKRLVKYRKNNRE